MHKPVKIYSDSGANIKFLKNHAHLIDIYQFPYDSSHRPKKRPKLAEPSALQWRHWHTSWAESTFQWSDSVGSKYFSTILAIVGHHNYQDALHLDSSYKSDCKIFLTSDKRDIWSKRAELEKLLGYRIFLVGCEDNNILSLILQLSQNS